MRSITIHINLIERTDLALLVDDGRRQAWVPLSQIEEVTEEPGTFGPVVVAIVIPDWLAADKGLNKRLRDEATLSLFEGAAK